MHCYALLRPVGPLCPRHVHDSGVSSQIFSENTGLKLQRRAYIVWDNDGPQRVLLVKKVDDRPAALMLEEIGKWSASLQSLPAKAGMPASLCEADILHSVIPSSALPSARTGHSLGASARNEVDRLVAGLSSVGRGTAYYIVAHYTSLLAKIAVHPGCSPAD